MGFVALWHLSGSRIEPIALNVTKDVFLCELKAIIQHENTMNMNIYMLNYTAATLRKQKL